MSNRKTFVIPLTDGQIKNILICLDLAWAIMEQYKVIYEDMIDDVKNLKRLFNGYLGGELR